MYRPVAQASMKTLTDDDGNSGETTAQPASCRTSFLPRSDQAGMSRHFATGLVRHLTFPCRSGKKKKGKNILEDKEDAAVLQHKQEDGESKNKKTRNKRVNDKACETVTVE